MNLLSCPQLVETLRLLPVTIHRKFARCTRARVELEHLLYPHAAPLHIACALQRFRYAAGNPVRPRGVLESLKRYLFSQRSRLQGVHGVRGYRVTTVLPFATPLLRAPPAQPANITQPGGGTPYRHRLVD